MHDASGEKHIADVRTPDRVVIEFQHSHMCAEERAARETFYQDMVWVVDGTRLRRDLPRFIEGARALRPLAQGVFVHAFPDELFPKSWLGCTAPAFFDFGATTDAAATTLVDGHLWCLLPQRHQRAIVLKFSRDAFMGLARDNAMPFLLALRRQIELKPMRIGQGYTTPWLKHRPSRPWRQRRPIRRRRRIF